MTRPLLLGHRGARASRHVPENTLASFELCLQHGCDGFEFDVRQSADGHAVVCHDPVVRKMEVAKTPAAALGLPGLGEVLQAFAGRAFLDIELKVGGLETETISLLREHPPQRGYVISSFLPEVLVALHHLDDQLPLGVISDRAKELKKWKEMAWAWVIPHCTLANRILIEQVHESGKKIMVWTVNDEDEMRRYAELGVEAIISDDTERLVRTLRSG